MAGTNVRIENNVTVVKVNGPGLRGPQGPAGADGPPGPPGDPASVTPEAVQSALSADQAAGRAALALGTAATRNVGTTAGTVAAGDDARLSDPRTPLAHQHPSTDISDSTATGRSVLTAADAAAARSVIGADISGAASAAITAHESASDPHPQYTTVGEAGAAAPVQSVAGRTGDVTLTTTDIGGLGTAATANTTDFATAAQGATADTALQPADGLAALDAAAATKLAGIATGATANATDAQLRDRATHTGTQPSTTITGLGDAATRDVGTTAGTVAAGDDARLSDARTPTAHAHLSTGISDSTATGRAVLTAADAEAARTAIDAPSSAQLAGVQATAEAALPKAGGTITGQTTHAVLGEVQRRLAVSGMEWWEAVGKGDQFAHGYYRVGLSVDAAPLPLSASWVFGANYDGGFVARVSISSPKYTTSVLGRGNGEILAWRGDGTNFAGTCVVGHDYNYAPPGTQPNHTHLAFGPADGSEMCVRDSSGEIKTRIDMSGNLRTLSDITPITDLDGSCGDASRRWTQVHAQDGTIQTSDARLKSAVEPLSPALIAIGLQCARETGCFRWLARIAEVGEAARWHIGLTAQRVAEIFALHGEDAYAYGIVCYDTWPERVEIVTPAEYEQRDTGTLDEHDMPVYETIETTPAVTRTIPAGDAYSLRYDELSRLIAAAMIARQDALEARIAALESAT